MLLQTIAVVVLLAAALFFVGRRAWQAFFAKQPSGCANGCGACGALDVERLQRTIEVREATLRQE